MLPDKIAFVDTETTGLNVTQDRIIEIGILRVENNKITKTFQSLINPQMYVSPLIESLTGIKKADLDSAPLFEDVVKEIEDIFEDCVFVAHNVRFDYGFLKNEFERVEKKFFSKHFCSAKLSRKLFPRQKHHNLDSIIERFNISCKNRHRAFDDANVLQQFYKKLLKKFPAEKLEKIIDELLGKPTLPANVSTTSIENLPNSPGVYIFYGANDVPLYIGKSKHIKTRVLSHFTSDHESAKEMNLCQQVTYVDSIETSGELSAYLKESALIKKMQPIYNRKLRVSQKLIMVKQSKNSYGYKIAQTEVVTRVPANDIENVLGIFKSKKQAKEFLIKLCKDHTLCEKLLGIEKGPGPCFAYRLHACKGACVQEEKALVYNLRFDTAFLQYKLKSWPFSGAIIIEGFIIDKWCLLGIVHCDADIADMQNEKQEYLFDVDTYKILVKTLHQPNMDIKIVKY